MSLPFADWNDADISQRDKNKVQAAPAFSHGAAEARPDLSFLQIILMSIDSSPRPVVFCRPWRFKTTEHLA
jgi:hypothetical protein